MESKTTDDLFVCKFSDAAVFGFAKFIQPDARILDVSLKSIELRALKQLLTPALTRIVLHGCWRLNDDVLAVVASKCPKLVEFNATFIYSKEKMQSFLWINFNHSHKLRSLKHLSVVPTDFIEDLISLSPSRPDFLAHSAFESWKNIMHMERFGDADKQYKIDLRKMSCSAVILEKVYVSSVLAISIALGETSCIKNLLLNDEFLPNHFINALRVTSDVAGLLVLTLGMVGSYPGKIIWSTVVTASTLELRGWGFNVFRGKNIAGLKDDDLFDVTLGQLLCGYKSIAEKICSESADFFSSTFTPLFKCKIDPKEMTPLSILIASEKLDAAKILMDNIITEVEVSGWALISLLSTCKWTKELYKFFVELKYLAKTDSCWDYKDVVTGDSLLHIVARHYKRLEMDAIPKHLFKRLLGVIMCNKTSILHPNLNGETVPMIAYKLDKLEIVEFLKEHDVEKPKQIETILACCEHSTTELFKDLISLEIIRIVHQTPIMGIRYNLPKDMIVKSCFLIHFLVIYPSCLEAFVSCVQNDLQLPNSMSTDILNSPLTLNDSTTINALEFAMLINAPIRSIKVFLNSRCVSKKEPWISYLSNKISAVRLAISSKKVSDFNSSRDTLLNVLEAIPDSKIGEIRDWCTFNNILILHALMNLKVSANAKGLAVLEKFISSAKMEISDDAGDSVLHMLARHHPLDLFPQVISKIGKDVKIDMINKQHQNILHTFLEYSNHTKPFQPESAKMISGVISSIIGRLADRRLDFLLANDKFQRNPIMIGMARFVGMDTIEWFKSYIPLGSRNVSSQIFISLCKAFPNFEFQGKQMKMRVSDFILIMNKLPDLGTFDPNHISEAKKTGYDYIYEKWSEITPEDGEVILQAFAQIGARSTLQLNLKQEVSSKSKNEIIKFKYTHAISTSQTISQECLLIPDETGQLPIHIYCRSRPSGANWKDRVKYFCNGDYSLLNTPDCNMITPIMYVIYSDCAMLSGDKLGPVAEVLSEYATPICPFSELDRCVSFFWPARLLKAINASQHTRTVVTNVFISFIGRLIKFASLDINAVDIYGNTVLDIFYNLKNEYGDLFGIIENGLKSLGAQRCEVLFNERRTELCPELSLGKTILKILGSPVSTRNENIRDRSNEMDIDSLDVILAKLDDISNPSTKQTSTVATISPIPNMTMSKTPKTQPTPRSVSKSKSLKAIPTDVIDDALNNSAPNNSTILNENEMSKVAKDPRAFKSYGVLTKKNFNKSESTDIKSVDNAAAVPKDPRDFSSYGTLKGNKPSVDKESPKRVNEDQVSKTPSKKIKLSEYKERTSHSKKVPVIEECGSLASSNSVSINSTEPMLSDSTVTSVDSPEEPHSPNAALFSRVLGKCLQGSDPIECKEKVVLGSGIISADISLNNKALQASGGINIQPEMDELEEEDELASQVNGAGIIQAVSKEIDMDIIDITEIKKSDEASERLAKTSPSVGLLPKKWKSVDKEALGTPRKVNKGKPTVYTPPAGKEVVNLEDTDEDQPIPSNKIVYDIKKTAETPIKNINDETGLNKKKRKERAQKLNWIPELSVAVAPAAQSPIIQQSVVMNHKPSMIQQVLNERILSAQSSKSILFDSLKERETQIASMKHDLPRIFLTEFVDDIDNHQGPHDVALFEACSQNDDLKMTKFIRSGVSVTILNDYNQHPLHVWCNAISESEKQNQIMLKTAFLLYDRVDAQSILNHLDSFGATPLSIMVTHDVWRWSETAGKTWLGAATVSNAHVTECALTREFKIQGANICATDHLGRTVWHGLAEVMFSYDEPISGFPNSITRFTPRLAALLLNQFIKGKLDVNVQNADGFTGLDLFVKRRRTGRVNLEERNYQIVMNELNLLDCKVSPQL